MLEIMPCYKFANLDFIDPVLSDNRQAECKGLASIALHLLQGLDYAHSWDGCT